MKLRNLIPRETKLQLLKAAILPIFTYCHLVWHFCRSSDCYNLERIQERVVRAILYDKMSSYIEFLNKANLCSLQNRRLQDLAIVTCKVKSNLCPSYIAVLFQRSNAKYDLRNKGFVVFRFNSVKYGKHSVGFSGPKVWDLYPVILESCQHYYLLRKTFVNLNSFFS